MTDYLLTLSTNVAPAKKFLVDGVEYELLGMDLLSKDDEAEVLARFSKYAQTSNDLSIESDLVKGKRLAASLRTQRVALLCKLTTLDKEVAAKIPTQDAVKLIEAVQALLEDEDDDDQEGEGNPEDAV